MLNYDNPLALANAFKQGAKFKIRRANGQTTDVTNITVVHGRLNVVDCNGVWHSFNPNGTNRVSSAQIVRADASLGFMTPVGRPPVSLQQLLAQAIARQTDERIMGAAAAAKSAQPFLQQFVTGSPAYCPKTGEVVDSIVFREGQLEVGLVLGGKVGRTSTNYRHDGTHKHDAARSLRIGTPPPPAKPDVAVPVYLFEAVKSPGKFIALVQAELASPGLWRQVGFGTVTAQGKQRG